MLDKRVNEYRLAIDFSHPGKSPERSLGSHRCGLVLSQVVGYNDHKSQPKVINMSNEDFDVELHKIHVKRGKQGIDIPIPHDHTLTEDAIHFIEENPFGD